MYVCVCACAPKPESTRQNIRDEFDEDTISGVPKAEEELDFAF